MAEAAPEPGPRITVFGGSGFLGRRAVRHLVQRGFAVRIATRHAAGALDLFTAERAFVEPAAVDVHDPRGVAEALAGAAGVVNAVSLYSEHGRSTFRAVHVDAARRIAQLAREQGIDRLVHMSGIGADPQSGSAYIRARGLGEAAVREAMPGATILRSAVMFGPDDGFLNTIIGLLRALPVYPMFGKGETLLQPVHVENVGAAIAAMLQDQATTGRIYEIGGPETLSYADLLRLVATEIGVRPRLVEMPYGLWFGLAGALSLLPEPPVTRSQIELMEIDNVASGALPGLDALGIAPLGLRPTIREIRESRRH
jgi:NADH dehydrogenase